MKPKAAKRGAARLLRRGVAGILALAGVGMAAVAAGLPPLPEQSATVCTFSAGLPMNFIARQPRVSLTYAIKSSNSMGYSRVPTRPMPSRSLPEGSAHSSGVNLRTFSRPSFSARRSFIPPSALSKLVCMEYAEMSLRTRVRTIRPIASDSVTLDSG